jgi:diguanylate cyclase (GGDEF)-like protein
MSMQRLRTDFQFAVVTLFAVVAVLGIGPFAIYRLLNHQLLAAAVDALLVLVICGGLAHVWRGGDVRNTALVLVVTLCVGAVVAVHVIGVPALLWMYPLLAGNFLMVQRTRALAITVALVAYLAFWSPVFTEQVQAVVFVMTSLVTCLFAYIFSERAERQRLALESLADHDALTGACNRRTMARELEVAIDDARRLRMPAGLALMDLDNFKRVNDINGHEDGDRVLVRFADLVRANVRTGDRFFRTGGEEFLVLAPRTDAGALRTLAERLRRDAAESLGAGEPRVTVSIGLATLRPGETASQWLARADAAMYRAKHEGRDRVVADPDPAAP